MAGPAVRIVAQALAAMSSVSKQFTLNVPCLISEEEKKKGRKEERSKKKKRKAILVSVNKYTTYVVCGCDQEIDAVPHPHSRKVQKYTYRWHDTSFKINAVHICVVLQKTCVSCGAKVRVAVFVLEHPNNVFAILRHILQTLC